MRLKRLTKGEPELKLKLETLLRPPAQGRKKWQQQEARWRKRAMRETTRRHANKRDWKEYLDANVAGLASIWKYEKDAESDYRKVTLTISIF